MGALPVPSADYLLDDLVDAVGAVCRHCRPDDPQRTSRPEFDRCRAEVPEFADAPTARQICRRIGLRWQSLLEAIFGEADHTTKAIRARVRARQDDAPALPAAHVAAALRAAARLLNQRSLRPREYRRARRQMLGNDRRRWLHGGQLSLPTEGQILRVAGDWDRALDLAGLEPREERTPDKPHSAAELLALCIDEFGTLPTSRELEVFARARGLPMGRHTESHQESVQRVTAERAQRGLATPAKPPPTGARPDYTQISDRSQLGRGRVAKRHSRADIVEGLIVFLDELSPDEWATQDLLEDLSSGDPRIPPPSTVGRAGRFDELISEARRKRRQRNAAE